MDIRVLDLLGSRLAERPDATPDALALIRQGVRALIVEALHAPRRAGRGLDADLAGPEPKLRRIEGFNIGNLSLLFPERRHRAGALQPGTDEVAPRRLLLGISGAHGGVRHHLVTLRLLAITGLAD